MLPVRHWQESMFFLCSSTSQSWSWTTSFWRGWRRKGARSSGRLLARPTIPSPWTITRPLLRWAPGSPARASVKSWVNTTHFIPLFFFHTALSCILCLKLAWKSFMASVYLLHHNCTQNVSRFGWTVATRHRPTVTLLLSSPFQDGRESGHFNWSAAFFPEQRWASCSLTRGRRKSLQSDHGPEGPSGGLSSVCVCVVTLWSVCTARVCSTLASALTCVTLFSTSAMTYIYINDHFKSPQQCNRSDKGGQQLQWLNYNYIDIFVGVWSLDIASTQS